MSCSSEACWDQQFDVVVVGSGAAGMTASLCAHEQGLSTVVLESRDKYGGVSAVSAGGIWIPCNDDIAKLGGTDSYEEALTYVKYLTRGEVPLEHITAYLRNAPAMVRYLREKFGVQFRGIKLYPDYYPNRPGGKNGSRSMEPDQFDASLLGEEFDRQREPLKTTLLLGRVAVTQVEAHKIITRRCGWIWLVIKVIACYWLDIIWRRRTPRDRRLVLGQALVGSLRYAMLKKNIQLLLNTPMESLIEQGGRVTGVTATHNGRRVRIAARCGVVLACGGFESNQAMRERYLSLPTRKQWSAAPAINNGDGILEAQAVGATVSHMNLVWGAPTMKSPGAQRQTTLFVERNMPGCVAVNSKGVRFVNEAAVYPDFRDAMYADDSKGNGTVPCWLVFDSTFRKKYPVGILLPGYIKPDSKLPREWADFVYFKSNTLDVLAGKIGVNAKGLAETVAKMNRYAESGIDPEFGKGSTVIDRYYSDSDVKPNPCLGPIVKPPFYAVRLDAGEIGTKGGLVTDEKARVLRIDGSVIGGLYAAGNTANPVMGSAYPGPGATLGPAMTFAYIAALDIGKAARRESLAVEL